VSEVAEGLSAAKARHVVHRDIKPSNLFRTTDGVWKVLDFGLGCVAGGPGSLTGDAILGTIGYLSPEQVRGEAVSHQTDVHGLALVAYHALTGRPAFPEREMAPALEAIQLMLPPRPSTLAPIPSEVDDVMRIALAKDPQDRFEDARVFAQALERAMRGELEHSTLARAAHLQPDWPKEIPSHQAR